MTVFLSFQLLQVVSTLKFESSRPISLNPLNQYHNTHTTYCSYEVDEMLTIIDNSNDDCGTSGCNLMGVHHGSK